MKYYTAAKTWKPASLLTPLSHVLDPSLFSFTYQVFLHISLTLIRSVHVLPAAGSFRRADTYWHFEIATFKGGTLCCGSRWSSWKGSRVVNAIPFATIMRKIQKLTPPATPTQLLTTVCYIDTYIGYLPGTLFTTCIHLLWCTVLFLSLLYPQHYFCPQWRVAKLPCVVLSVYRVLCAYVVFGWTPGSCAVFLALVRFALWFL
jgi:hypothetical protein